MTGKKNLKKVTSFLSAGSLWGIRGKKSGGFLGPPL
jgi:hypothetical protein